MVAFEMGQFKGLLPVHPRCEQCIDSYPLASTGALWTSRRDDCIPISDQCIWLLESLMKQERDPDCMCGCTMHLCMRCFCIALCVQ